MNSQHKFFNEGDLYAFFELIGKEFDDDIRLWLITKVVAHVKSNPVFIDQMNTSNGQHILLNMDLVYEFVNELLMDILIALESSVRPHNLQQWTFEEVVQIVYNPNEADESTEYEDSIPSLLAIRMAEINKLPEALEQAIKDQQEKSS